MDDFNPVAAVAPVANLIASLGAGRRYPLRTVCFGEIEVRSDDPEIPTYVAPGLVTLAEYASLDEAMAGALALRHDLPAPTPAASRSLPTHIAILDGEQCLVLAGELAGRGVIWCDPVTSDGEARQVVEQASKLRGRAFFEAGRGEPAVAAEFRQRAGLLEGRLVDPWWRDMARLALLQAA